MQFLGFAVFCAVSLLSATSLVAQDSSRVTQDLLVLYTFDSGGGKTVKDRSGVSPSLDLKIKDEGSVKWRQGSLVVRSSTLINSMAPAMKITEAIQRSGSLTIEAWVKPNSDRQSGPARIVSLSSGPNERNLTLGQDGNRYDVRLRTATTSANGIPSTSTPANSLRTSLTHVVYVRNKAGKARIYLNGKQRASKQVAGKLNGWNSKFLLCLANEQSGDRPWLGELHLVAVYARDLSSKEISRNHAAGANVLTKGGKLAAQTSPSPSTRVQSGLRALYSFDEGSGNVVRDQSGNQSPLDLKIAEPAAVRWIEGALEIRSAAKIQSSGPARKIIGALKRTNAATVEAWVKPANTKQAGPARIVSISTDSSQRNITLGQEGGQFDVRLRTTKTSSNGIPSTATPANVVRTALTHVVYTRDRSGNARLYVDGKQRAERKVAGDLSSWNDRFPISLANEVGGGRPWLGTLDLVAIYDRALNAGEIKQNFQAGTQLAPPVSAEKLALARHERFFERKIAPLLSRRCLECHDASTKEGDLDLAQKMTALAGGGSGNAIVPGKIAESLLWELVESGDMPPDGDPLSDKEKALFRQWIESGAVWSGEMIDPAIYVQDDGGEKWLQRLTIAEYIETVRESVGVDIAKEARSILPPDLRADGFTNTAYNLNVDLKHVEAYARLAEMIVQQMDVPKFAARFSKSRSLNTDATARKFVEAMGKWLFRGPLTQREEIIYSGIGTTVASAGGSYEEGVSLMIEAMLQSPRFIYRIEDQQSIGPLSDYEIASRLSYIIWGGSPDAELMRAADAGELSDRDHVKAQAERLLKDPRAVARSLQFVADWLDVDRLTHMQPNEKRFPGWSAELADDMRQETLSFFDEIVWKRNRPLAELMNAQVTFATPRLAKHYGLKPQGNGVQQYDVSGVPSRGGLLTQGSVLTIGGDDASMVTRGLFVLKDVLRGTVGDPPPGLDTTPVPSKPGLSQRLVAEKRIENVACSGCHVKFEPLAFGLEKFDGIGAYHDKDEFGNTLRDDGEILFPGAAKAIKYESSAELMDLLAGNKRVSESITWKVTQFALGRPLGPGDARQVKKIHEAAQKSGGTYQSLITEIVTSDLVRMNRSTNFEE